jgi:hypothetical protein
MKIAKVNSTFKTKNHPCVTIVKADFFADNDRIILHTKYQHFGNYIKMHDFFHPAIANHASPSMRIMIPKPPP